jgi:hypothetical protein
MVFDEDGTLHITGRQLVTAGICIFLFALYVRYVADLHFIDAVNAVVLSFFWPIAVAGTLRTLWLPVQFLRHRAALSRMERREAEWERLAASDEPGAAGARLNLIVSRGRNPRIIDWWHW